MSQVTQALVSLVQEKIQHLDNVKLEVEKQRLLYALHHLEANGESASKEHLQKYVQKNVAINSLISSLQIIKSKIRSASSQQQSRLLQVFGAYLSQEQTKESALANIELEQKKWAMERAACQQKLAASHKRVKCSQANLEQNDRSRDAFFGGGAFLGGASGGGGFLVSIVASSQYGILAFLYPPFWLVLAGVAVISALVVGSIFCGLHFLATKNTIEKEEQNIKEAQVVISELRDELAALDKKQEFAQHVLSCLNDLDGVEVLESCELSRPQAENQSRLSQHSNAFFAPLVVNEGNLAAAQELRETPSAKCA